MASGAIAHCGETQIGIGCVKLRPGGMSIDVALSTCRDVAATPILCRKKTRLRREWHVNG